MNLRLAIFVLLSSLIYSSCQKNSNEQRPLNVVFFLIDDMGWTDLGCYGSTFYETPHIDQLARNGIKFTNAYTAAAVCSPSRASILTGEHPVQVNITDWIPGLDPKNRPLLGTTDQNEMSLDEITLAEMLQSNGYATGYVGKWHLGSEGFHPEQQGFDVNIGGHWAGQPASYFYPYKNDRQRWDVPHLEGGYEGEYLTDRLTGEAIEFIDEHRQDPFFLYLAHYAVHTPIQAKPELVEKYQKKLDSLNIDDEDTFVNDSEGRTRQLQNDPEYAAMVESVDESVGLILAKLEELGIQERTLVIFTSDNGGLSTLPNWDGPTSVKPLRAGKGWLYEGGVRVPLIVQSPNQTQKGITSDAIVTGTDFLPTIMNELKLSGGAKPMTGIDFLNSENDWKERTIYWHFPHYHGSGNRPSSAIRKGDYKLLFWYEDEKVELYNLKNDLSENDDLSVKEPEKAKSLLNDLQQWLATQNASLPKVNPDYVQSD